MCLPCAPPPSQTAAHTPLTVDGCIVEQHPFISDVENVHLQQAHGHRHRPQLDASRSHNSGLVLGRPSTARAHSDDAAYSDNHMTAENVVQTCPGRVVATKGGACPGPTLACLQ